MWVNYDLVRDGDLQLVKGNPTAKKTKIENMWVNYDLVRDGDVQVVKEDPTAGEGGKEDEHRQVDQLEDRKWKWKLRNTNQSLDDVLHPVFLWLHSSW